MWFEEIIVVIIIIIIIIIIIFIIIIIRCTVQSTTTVQQLSSKIKYLTVHWDDFAFELQLHSWYWAIYFRNKHF